MTAYEVRADPPASKPWGGEGFRLAWSLDRHIVWGSRRGKTRFLCSQLPKPQLLTGKSICSLLNCYWYSMFQHIPGKTPNRLRSEKFDTHPQLPSYIHRDILVPAGLIYTCTGQFGETQQLSLEQQDHLQITVHTKREVSAYPAAGRSCPKPQCSQLALSIAPLLHHESPSPLSHSPTLLGMAVLGK